MFSQANLYWIGDYSLIFLLGFTAYAIVKHHLFNIKIIATQTAVIVINIILLIQVFTAPNITEGLLTGLFWVIVAYGSWILVQSVKKEIYQRKEMERLTKELAAANERGGAQPTVPHPAVRVAELIQKEDVNVVFHRHLNGVGGDVRRGGDQDG